MKAPAGMLGFLATGGFWGRGGRGLLPVAGLKKTHYKYKQNISQIKQLVSFTFKLLNQNVFQHIDFLNIRFMNCSISPPDNEFKINCEALSTYEA